MGRRVGAALVALGGAVASTVVAGVELLRLGLIGGAAELCGHAEAGAVRRGLHGAAEALRADASASPLFAHPAR